MKENIFPYCKICYTLVNKHDKYCLYCGYKNFLHISSYKRLSLLRDDHNNGINFEDKDKIHIFKKRLRDSPAYKVQVIRDRIHAEEKRIEELNEALKNILDKNIAKKISVTKGKIVSLVIDLYICSLDLEFARYRYSFCTIVNYIQNLKSYTINAIIDEISTDFSMWTHKIEVKKKNHNREYNERIDEYLFKCHKEFSLLKEKIGLEMAEKTLKSTSLLNVSVNSDTEYKEEIDNNYQEIIYEIDRIESELEI